MPVASATSILIEYGLDPSLIMEDCGFAPDPWQRAVMRSRAGRRLMLCARQTGKSTATAFRALAQVLTRRNALVLLLSPSENQSKEIFLKARTFYEQLGMPVAPARNGVKETSLTLRNGSRLIALPNNPRTVRGFSAVTEVVVDEAALVDDELYTAVTPMLGVSQGTLTLLCTPKGQRGYFWEQWEHGGALWERTAITADKCSRLTSEFLESERMTMGDRMFGQEFRLEFLQTLDQYFSTEDINAAFGASPDPPLF